jgi:alkanesulfonate monooxygenase SsuD/methylene tetrahydromethanopterin reductase-like flavin-dependent oxidoreductase (luciferase family)
MSRFYIGFDMRSPDFGAPTPTLYGAALEMAAYADAHGVDYAVLMEHHGSPDGYLPAPLTLAAAIAARTSRMRILLGAIVLPLHDPVNIAEQMVVVDQLSNGRLDVVFGAGYVPSEFRMFNVNIKERGKILDETLPIILRALSGERFVANGREIFVRPPPVQKPHPRIFVGGGVPATARRAAGLGLGLFPLGPQIVPLYLEECARLGREPGPVLIQSSWMHVTEDPERAWSILAPHMIHVARSYAEYAEEAGWTASPFAGVDTLAKVKSCGMFLVVTPDECVKFAQDAHRAGTDPGLMPLVGGLEPRIGWESLELFVSKVLPKFGRAAIGTTENTDVLSDH